MILIFYYFLLLFIYSILGWIMETIYTSIQARNFIDRGFLIGPYCPIYGWGALFMLLYLNQYKSNVLTVFLLGAIICSILEYLTSYVMEVLFKTRWWDYSNRKFNLNGRVCGLNTILFGICGIAVIYIIQPLLEYSLGLLSDKIIIIISVICFVIFLTDIIISLNVINKFKKTITNIDLHKDSTQDFSKMVYDTLRDNHQILQKRLIKAFPSINFQKIIDLKNELTGELKILLKK